MTKKYLFIQERSAGFSKGFLWTNSTHICGLDARVLTSSYYRNGEKCTSYIGPGIEFFDAGMCLTSICNIAKNYKILFNYH